jgi:acyl carrier protein
MNRRERLVQYVRDNLEPEFDPERQPLTQLLDSVSLMQLIMFIDQELRVPLDLSSLSLEWFATVDTLVTELNEVKREG